MNKITENIIGTKKPLKLREHNHFPDGKTGYVPKSVGMNPYSKQGKKVFYK